MAIQDLDQLGRVEKEVVINGKMKVKLHTLAISEQQKVLMEIPQDIVDEATKFMYLQPAVLIYATESINDEKCTIEEKRKFYQKLQVPIVSQLFSEYLSLSSDQAKVLEDLKKK